MAIAFRFPWLRFSIASELSVAEARSALARHVREGKGKRVFSFGAADVGDEPFCGKLVGDRFEIARRIRYRNSFLPLIRGTIRPDGHGTIIDVSMRMWAPVILFMAIWMTGVMLGGIVGLYVAFTQGQPLGLLALVMMGFGVAMITGGFGSEAVIAEELLRGIFGSSPEQNGT